MVSAMHPGKRGYVRSSVAREDDVIVIRVISVCACSENLCYKLTEFGKRFPYKEGLMLFSCIVGTRVKCQVELETLKVRLPLEFSF